MPELAKQDVRRLLQSHLNALHKEAIDNKSTFQFSKASGLGGLLLGGIGCIAFPPLGILGAATGACLWLGSALIEATVTGQITPLPYTSTRITSLAGWLDRANGGGPSDEDLELTHFLPAYDRAAYLLILCQGERIAELLSHVDLPQVDATFAAIVQQTTNIYGSSLTLEAFIEEGVEHIDEAVGSIPQFKALAASPPSTRQVAAPKEAAIAPTIGTNTRLNAIPAAVEVVQDDEEDMWAAPSVPTMPTAPVAPPPPAPMPTKIDPCCDVRTIANSGYLESVIWIGPSRSGKTVAADQLYQEYVDRYPTLKVWYITPVYRADPDNSELDLFQGATVARFDLLNEWNQEILSTCYAEYERLLDEFLAAESNAKNPKLFICDELSIHRIKAFADPTLGYAGNEAATRFYGKFINAIAANSSGGKAVGIGLWGIAPIGAVTGLGLKQFVLSAMTSVFVSHVDAWNGLVWGGAKKNNLAPSTEPTEDFKRSVRGLGVDRIVSIGCGDWKPLKKYQAPVPVTAG